MARLDRLIRLMQALRTLPPPVTAEQLAAETDVSVRSIYRDVESLRVAGAEIAGERGLGYFLVEDGALAPQTFTRIEIEALTLGLAEVQHIGDADLAKAAQAALAKVVATVRSESQQHILHAVSRVHRFEDRRSTLPDMQIIREACWREEALLVHYLDRDGKATRRKIWPLGIVYVDQALLLLTWCCLRSDFRMFRPERMRYVKRLGESFRPRRVALLREYQEQLSTQ